MSHADTSRIFQIKSITNKLEKIHKDRFQKANLLFDEAIKDKCPDDLEIMNSSNWYGIIRSSNDYMVLDSDFNKYNQWHCEVFLRKDWHDVVLHRKAMILEFEPNGSKLISAYFDDHDLLSCKNNILSCENDIQSCENDIQSCENDIQSCENDIQSCENDIQSCENDIQSCENDRPEP